MTETDLNVSVAYLSDCELRGRVIDDGGDGSWISAGAEVTVHVNPAGTTFTDPNILGSGRIYENRIEIDLVVAAGPASTLVQTLNQGDTARLHFSIRTVTASIFRIVSVIRS